MFDKWFFVASHFALQNFCKKKYIFHCLGFVHLLTNDSSRYLSRFLASNSCSVCCLMVRDLCMKNVFFSLLFTKRIFHRCSFLYACLLHFLHFFNTLNYRYSYLAKIRSRILLIKGWLLTRLKYARVQIKRFLNLGCWSVSLNGLFALHIYVYFFTFGHMVFTTLWPSGPTMSCHCK